MEKLKQARYVNLASVRTAGISKISAVLSKRLKENGLAQESVCFLIGAGTVLTPEQAQECIAAGAKFVISPVLNLETIKICNESNVAVMPDALTPTEIVTAWNAGADLIKVFPAGALGGANYIKSLKAPLPQIKIIPTGGVSLKTAADFIKAGAYALGVGADLIDLQALREGNNSILTERAREYIEIVRIARLDK